MDYYFPRQNIFLTAPYKNGCSSVLNYFIKIEKYLEKEQKTIQNVKTLEVINFDEELPVHNPDNNFYARNYSVNLNGKTFQRADLSLFIIHNPKHRYVSFWFDKVLGNVDESYLAMKSKLFPNGGENNLINIQDTAKKFLENLYQEIESTNIDVHLMRQIYALKGRTYGAHIDTKDLNQIPNLLSHYSIPFKKYEVTKIAQINSTSSSLKQDFWISHLDAPLELAYRPDIMLYQYFKEKNIDSNEAFELLINYEHNRIKLIETTNLLNEKSIEIEAMKAAETWRIMAPIRRILTWIKKFIF